MTFDLEKAKQIDEAMDDVIKELSSEAFFEFGERILAVIVSHRDAIEEIRNIERKKQLAFEANLYDSQ